MVKSLEVELAADIELATVMLVVKLLEVELVATIELVAYIAVDRLTVAVTIEFALTATSIVVVISPLELTVSLLEPNRTIPVFRLAELETIH